MCKLILTWIIILGWLQHKNDSFSNIVKMSQMTLIYIYANPTKNHITHVDCVKRFAIEIWHCRS